MSYLYNLDKEWTWVIYTSCDLKGNIVMCIITYQTAYPLIHHWKVCFTTWANCKSRLTLYHLIPAYTCTCILFITYWQQKVMLWVENVCYRHQSYNFHLIGPCSTIVHISKNVHSVNVNMLVCALIWTPTVTQVLSFFVFENKCDECISITDFVWDCGFNAETIYVFPNI